MLFKKKDKESKPKKEKKVPVMKVGTHKKTVIALWLVLIASVSFGVYKNFTAIDMHTVHENGESPVELPKPSDCFGNTQ